MSISQRIIKKRESLNLTQTNLAKRAGLKPQAISQYESGARNPSYEALIKLSSALSVTTDYLLSGKYVENDLFEDKSLKILLNLVNVLSAEDRDKLVDYAKFLINNYHYSDIPVLNNAIEYADYLLKTYKVAAPIDVEEIARKLDIKIYKQADDMEYEGILIKGRENLIILKDSIKYESRKRFTIATLIGHAIIPWHVKSQYNIRKSGTSTLLTEDIQEMEAQNFAANLIMPKSQLKEELNKSTLSLEKLDNLSKSKYNVSLTVLLNRLVEIDKDKYAVVNSKDGEITKTCQGNRPLVDLINKNSKAATFFNNPSVEKEIRSEKMPAYYWFVDAESNENVYEQSIYNPDFSSVLTFLTIEDKK